jgi:oligosaccharide translocation protein RFT1
MTGFACILELLVEPLYILSQKKKYYNIRVYTEPAASLLRCLMTFILVKGYADVVINILLFTVMSFCSYYLHNLLPRVSFVKGIIVKGIIITL